jgi:hypothetical protein
MRPAVLLLLISCTSASLSDTSSTTPLHDVGTYTSPDGWTIDMPAGWHVAPFETSKGGASARGAQVSNIELPSPSLVPGFPIQTNGDDLPADGLAIIIAIDDDPSDVQQPPQSPPAPPLSLDDFSHGSAPAGSPTLDLMWFTGNGRTFLATIKTGPNVSAVDRTALEAAVSSVRFS